MNMSDEVVMMPKRPEMASLSLYYLWKSWNGMFVVSIKCWLIKIRRKKKNLSSASTHRIISCILNIVLVIFTKSIRIFWSWDLGESFIFNVGRIPKRKMREKYYYCKNTFTLVQSNITKNLRNWSCDDDTHHLNSRLCLWESVMWMLQMFSDTISKSKVWKMSCEWCGGKRGGIVGCDENRSVCGCQRHRSCSLRTARPRHQSFLLHTALTGFFRSSNVKCASWNVTGSCPAATIHSAHWLSSL